MLATTSTTATLMALQSAGLVLALTPERGLKVTPASSLTPELRGLLKAQRDDLVRWLTTEASNDPTTQPAPHPAPAVETIVETASLETIPSWQDLDREYQTHHIACPTCIAAGKGYGLRCGTGAALWAAYDRADPVRAQVRIPPRTETPEKPGIHPSLLTPATSVEIDTMVARLALFDVRGVGVDDAERLVDKLLVRDREGDRRGACAECRYRAGSGPGRWRCSDRAPTSHNDLAGAHLGAGLVHEQLHHCLSMERKPT